MLHPNIEAQHFPASSKRINASRQLAAESLKLFQAKRYEDWYSQYMKSHSELKKDRSEEGSLIAEAALQEETSEILYDLAHFVGTRAYVHFANDCWSAAKATGLLRQEPQMVGADTMALIKASQILSQSSSFDPR